MIGVVAVLRIMCRSKVQLTVVVLVFAGINCPMFGVVVVLRINCRSAVQ